MSVNIPFFTPACHLSLKPGRCILHNQFFLKINHFGGVEAAQSGGTHPHHNNSGSCTTQAAINSPPRQRKMATNRSQTGHVLFSGTYLHHQVSGRTYIAYPCRASLDGAFPASTHRQVHTLESCCGLHDENIRIKLCEPRNAKAQRNSPECRKKELRKDGRPACLTCHRFDGGCWLSRAFRFGAHANEGRAGSRSVWSDLPKPRQLDHIPRIAFSLAPLVAEPRRFALGALPVVGRH
ncbi:hypothetical protein FN846DRAFT_973178 [Sphaerosporella brunnea]|uniref:Uncharacterized protein n=1 Tax=Sphaerosporella brunnea TaxID=1250544 RepID=A0A5J5EGY6_9PEZI|nr:hypothetical protein FN846DRAFT_973178 [Sphaerosporella brunnea]